MKEQAFLFFLFSSYFYAIPSFFPHHIRSLTEERAPFWVSYYSTENYASFRKLRVKGLLFLRKEPFARKVEILLSEEDYQPIPMKRNPHGVWYYLWVPPKLIYPREIRLLYKYSVDGILFPDRKNPNYERGASFFYLPPSQVPLKEGAILLKEGTSSGRKVLFRIFAPNAQRIFLIGSWNQFTPYLYALEKKERGYFEIEVFLPFGEYLYKYRIDGEDRLDPKNPEKRYHPYLGFFSYVKVSP